jgi:hypothetical protein
VVDMMSPSAYIVASCITCSSALPVKSSVLPTHLIPLPNIVVKWVVLFVHIRVVPASDLGLETSYSV